MFYSTIEGMMDGFPSSHAGPYPEFVSLPVLKLFLLSLQLACGPISLREDSSHFLSEKSFLHGEREQGLSGGHINSGTRTTI